MAESTEDSRPQFSRRAFVRRGSGAALGVAAVWSVPSIRSTAVLVGAAGTAPPEVRADAAGASDPPGAPGDPAAAATRPASTGTLPLTGTDPRPLLIAGGIALAGGAGVLAVAQDPEPNRARD